MPPFINGVSLFGHTDSCYIYYGVGIAYALIFSYKLGLIKTSVLLGSSILGHVFHGERGCQLGILGVLLTLFIFRKIWLSYNKFSLSLLTLFTGLILTTGIIIAPKSEFAKNTAQQVDLIISIFSSSQSGIREGTKEHRLKMWKEILENTLKQNPVLGQGVKCPLVDVAFRNPHNSFITIFGRFGIAGLVLAIIIYFAMPVHNAIVLTRTVDPKLQQVMLLYLCFVPAFMGAVLFGPTLESPFSALVCNFIYGASLRCFDIALYESQAPAIVCCPQMAGQSPNCRWFYQNAQRQPTFE
jgi:O-antigen ligase